MSTERVGIFGGSFNPIHFGHINSFLTVTDSLKLDKVIVIPAHQSPNRPPLEGPTPDQRLEMVQLALSKYSDLSFIDSREIDRGGVSYTIETIRSLKKEKPEDDYFLILGLDQFESFSSWKDYKDILSEVHLVVTSRPGHFFPLSLEEFPASLRDLVDIYEFPQAHLKTGKWIYFVQLEDFNISASELRRKVRLNQDLTHWLPKEVISYIHEQKLYAPIGPRIGDDESFARFCAGVLLNRKGIQVKAYDVRALQTSSDYTLIASGTSTRHTSSLGESLLRAIREEYAVLPQGAEGLSEGRWVLLDYGNVVIHIFYDFLRQEYRLEDLWKSGLELTGLESKGGPS